MDLWQMIQNDQANILELCREIQHATNSGTNSRADLFEDLDTEMERHLRAKENVLYPALAREPRTRGYLPELQQEIDEIRDGLDDLSGARDKGSHRWAMDFQEVASTISLYFSLEENGILTVARGSIQGQEAEELRRAYEREKLASLEANRWHMPQSMMPSRYGFSTTTVLGALAGIAAIGAAAFAWRKTRHSHPSNNYRYVEQTEMPPSSPFPISRSGVYESGGMTSSGRSGRMTASAGAGQGGADMVHGTASHAGAQDAQSDTSWFSSANPPSAPSGLSTGLQPGGVAPGGGPGATAGSIGTGGGQTESRDTGSLKRDGR
ncbi:hemerythrin domain-containing protein [Microvirga roseola]|uniref:hemerythrin domain-containing protein n=1 Tax=Microvirga roseola TaxID=2883126 RepID=UPI001E6101D8|nr:hemerythrin domain-containing protein [Microvirga roseola]